MPETKKNHRFKKEERLCGKLNIETLFKKGTVFYTYPFRVMFLMGNESDVPAKVLITVPKKKFKLAVDRNLIKRRIRESYRLNKEILWSELLPKQLSVHFMLIYTSDEILDYKTIESKIIVTLHRLLLESGC